MGLGTPLVLDQDRRCQTLGAVQNTAEEVPRRAYCGDTVGCSTVQPVGKGKALVPWSSLLVDWRGRRLLRESVSPAVSRACLLGWWALQSAFEFSEKTGWA